MAVVTNRAASSSADEPNYLLTPIFPDRQLMGTDIKVADVTEIFKRAYPHQTAFETATVAIRLVGLFSFSAIFIPVFNDTFSPFRSPLSNIVVLITSVFILSFYKKVWFPYVEINLKKQLQSQIDFTSAAPLRGESLLLFSTQMPPSSETVHYYRLLSFPQVMELTGKDSVQIRAVSPFLNPYLKTLFQKVLEKQETFARAPSVADAVMNPADKGLYLVTPLLLEAVTSVSSPLYPKEEDRLREYQSEIQPEIDRLYRFRTIKLVFDRFNHAQAAKFYLVKISKRFCEMIRPDMDCLDVSLCLTKYKFDLLSGALLAESLDHLDERKRETVKEVARKFGITCPPFNELASVQ